MKRKQADLGRSGARRQWYIRRERAVSVDPLFIGVGAGGDPLDWDLYPEDNSTLIDICEPAIADPDGPTSALGHYGGTKADAWELDLDGYPLWWQPGPYDDATYPAEGWDCDDTAAGIHPGEGC